MAVLCTGPLAGIPYSYKDREAESSRGPMLVSAFLFGALVLVYSGIWLFAG